MSRLLLAILALVLLNVIVALKFWADKRKARKDKWRTKESTLLIAGLIAPVGALVGMHLFHHKTKKLKFLLIYVFLALHILAIWYLHYKGWL